MSPNIMMKQKGKGYQRIRAIEAFEYENTRSVFKCCHCFSERNEKPCLTQIPGTQGASSDNVTPNIDGCTDEPRVYFFLIATLFLYLWLSG